MSRYARLYSRTVRGIEAPLVTIDVHLSGGLPSIVLVGASETGLREAKERVRSAIQISGYKFPQTKVTINLAPAELYKVGSRFDLGIALALLLASGEASCVIDKPIVALGELSLSGEVCGIPDAFICAMASRLVDEQLLVPSDNIEAVQRVEGVHAVAVSSLAQAVDHLSGRHTLDPIGFSAHPEPASVHEAPELDFAEVQGQQHAVEAAEIAVAGRHHLLMVGSPGAGKTMIASRIPGLLPLLSVEEALEVAALYSLIQLPAPAWRQPPVRSPHHSASAVSLVGGNSHPLPGEISLAHNGVLFLDEVTEFSRRTLDMLREPLETGHITVSRARSRVKFPSSFLLVAASNPCACGYAGDLVRQCLCGEAAIRRYISSVSGPLLDRFDLAVRIQRPTPQVAVTKNRDTRTMRERVAEAHSRQLERGVINSNLQQPLLSEVAAISAEARQLLQDAGQKLGLSGRGIDRIARVSRTVADLAASDAVRDEHMAVALQLRASDPFGLR